MQYDGVVSGRFLSRPNRFTAYIEIDGKTELCHVKTTGRCRELLIPGTEVYLQRAFGGGRKTAFDLIAVNRGDKLVNIDSQIPNRVFEEWAENGGIPGLQKIKAEQTFIDSRLDFYLEAGEKKIFVEIKGVTLEREGVALFPDAPTERGIKHLNTLCRCIECGYEAWAVFIIQMENVMYFAPNDQTHLAFGAALRRAAEKGVRIFALECAVTPDSIRAVREVPVRL